MCTLPAPGRTETLAFSFLRRPRASRQAHGQAFPSHLGSRSARACRRSPWLARNPCVLRDRVGLATLEAPALPDPSEDLVGISRPQAGGERRATKRRQPRCGLCRWSPACG